MKQYNLLFILIFFPFFLLAQDMSVRSFTKLENDLDARVNFPKKDQDGKKCAIIKVKTTQTGFTWDVGSLGVIDVVQKTAEYWLYVPHGVKRITISHSKLGLIRNWVIPIPVEEAVCYELDLVAGNVKTIVEDQISSQWIVITADPVDAMIFINDNYEATGSLEKKFKPGKYSYRIEAPLYLSDAGAFELTLDKKFEQKIKLKINHGFANITSTPEDGAEVMIDRKKTNLKTPCKSDPLEAGDHVITIKKPLFKPSTQKISIVVGQTTNVNLKMESGYANLEVQLPSNANLYINNDYKTMGSWSGKIDAGIYTLEARSDNHITAKQDIELVAGDNKTVTLAPYPINGTLEVLSKPNGATVLLNGKEIGTTPFTKDKILIGDYSLTIKKPGYNSVTKTIKIINNKTTEVNETLYSELNIRLSADNCLYEAKYERKEDRITFYYSIRGLKQDQLCNVEFVASIDGGITYVGTLKELSGDVGKINSNGQKSITWNFNELNNIGKNLDIKLNGEIVTVIPSRTIISYSFSPYSPYGLMIGRVSRWGIYAKFKMNGSFTKGDYTYENGTVSDYTGTGYYEINSSTMRSVYGVTIGGLRRVTSNVFLYAGAGYGSKTKLLKMNEFSYITFEKTGEAWATDSYNTSTGLEFELGAMVRYNKLLFSVGSSSFNGQRWSVIAGLGVIF
ncbi:MAG: PEGA domain-containing protein [Tenuifilaceae bacterium]